MPERQYYSLFIEKTVPKVLTQVDRDNMSTTYGCCDRNFWHLKVRDFSSAILQQTGLAMALLYLVDFPGNKWYKKQCMKDWAEATVYYWKKIQLKDGSFNEYYPHEHGFPPTAFSLYSSCEVYKRLKMKDADLERAFAATAKWLCSHIEKQAYNQELASITALYSCYTVLKEDWILQGLKKKLKRILKLQSADGWFAEYGGADIGYLSVSLDMLAEYYWMSKDKSVLKALERTAAFIKYFIHPDGTAGGEYGSRNTTYFLPNGLEVLICEGNKDALAIRNYLFQKEGENGFFMDSVDDRYCSHYLLHSCLRALEKAKLNQTFSFKSPLLPCMEDGSKYFPESGLFTCTKDGNSLFVGLQKGGVLKLYKREKQVFLDCGYRVNYGGGKAAATNWQDSEYKYSRECDSEVMVSGRFNVVALKTPSPILHLGLRVIAFIFGNKIISFLKKKIILVDKHADMTFSRSIAFTEDHTVRIRDKIDSPNPVTLEAASNFSLRHVASGKFYSDSDICSRDTSVYKDIQHIVIEKTFKVDQELLEIKVLKRS